MAGTTYNATTVQSILKTYFNNKAVQNVIASKKGRIYADMPRSTDGGGDYCKFTQQLSTPFTISQDFTTAQSLAATSTVAPGLKYSMPWQEQSGPIRVSAKANLLSRTDKVAWFKAIGKAAADVLMMQHHVYSIKSLASGFGELAGSAISGVSGATFTVSNGAVVHFVEGMPLVFSSTLDTAVLRSGTAIKVTAVDYATGVVTCDTNLSTPGGVNGDFVFLAGDRQNSATPSRLCPVGLRHWLPTVRPVTDTNISTLEGTVRSTNSRSYGGFVDGTALDDIDAMAQAVQTAVTVGNATDLTAYVSHARFTSVATALSSDRRYADNNGNSGFLKISVSGSDITVPLVIDKNLEDNDGYILQKGVYTIVSCGELPMIQDEGGNWTKISDDNGIEMRTYGLGAFLMLDPAACCTVLFATLS